MATLSRSGCHRLPGHDYKLVFKGKVTDDEIHFQFGTEDGSWGADLVVKRAS